MRIVYAPGGCLRGWLTHLGHSLPDLYQAGLVTGLGYDAFVHRIVFPWKAIFMAVAFRLRHRHTASYRALKVACMLGGGSDSIRT